MSGRLAAVLARAIDAFDEEYLSKAEMDATVRERAEFVGKVLAAIPEPEREAMEAALDVCQYVYGTLASLDTVHCRLPEEAHGVGMLADHAYQPLVAP